MDRHGNRKDVIKASRGSGGTVGITNQKSALVRLILTRHFLESLSYVTLKGARNDANSQEETKLTAMKRDEEYVIELFEIFCSPLSRKA